MRRRQRVEFMTKRNFVTLRCRALGAGAIVLGGFSTVAHADWTGKGELGASFATGNSENESVNAALELGKSFDRWAHKLGFAGNYGSDGNVTTAQRWEVRAQSNYTLTDRAYAFGAGRYEDDRFSAYDFQATLSGGLGYKIIDSERTKFWLQGGPGYRYAEFNDTGESEDGVIFRGDLGFDHQLTQTTKVVERFLVETGSENTYLQNDLGLEVTIEGALALRIGYQVRHNTDVPPGVDKTDTLTTVGLIYEMK
jgi:putative salt-induced outer membrane protein